MRKVSRGFSNDPRSVAQKVAELCDASQQSTEEVADGFTVSNFTVTRTLNAGTATVTQLANVVATFIHDMQQRGSTRTNG